MINIVIVDDKIEHRNALISGITYEGEINVIWTAKNGREFLNNLEESKAVKPQIVLMDIDMPIMNGIETIEIAKIRYPEIIFIMLTVMDDEERIFDSIKAGASGYILKDESIEFIQLSIKQAMEFGAGPMSPLIANKAIQLLRMQEKPNMTEADHNLSKREFEILKLVVDGYDSAEIADLLIISPLTVRKHIANIYSKLHISNKTEAVKLALKKRWF